MASRFELFFYALLNYIPYSLLALYPFLSSLRFGRRKTVLFFLLFSVSSVTLFVLGFSMEGKPGFFLPYLASLLSVFFFFLCVKAQWGLILFDVFMVKNTANFVMILSKYVEGQLFPKTAHDLCRWSSSVSTALVILLITPAIFLIVKKYFSKSIHDVIFPSIWKYLWLVPVFFYAIWLYIFYFAPASSPVDLALQLSSTVFMFFFQSGQILIYVCIAEFMLNYSNAALLREENQRLSDQHHQYRLIQDHIQEVSRIKHDLRHQLVTLCSLADEGRFEQLQDYLHQYAKHVPDLKLSFSDNLPLNMVLSYYSQKCQDAGVLFGADISIPDSVVLSDSDVTVLFGNLMENAYDACLSMGEADERFVSVSGQFFQNQLIFVIRNSFANDYVVDSVGAVLSTKHKGPGIGMASARHIVEKHGGTMTVSPEVPVFTVSLIIPS